MDPVVFYHPAWTLAPTPLRFAGMHDIITELCRDMTMQLSHPCLNRQENSGMLTDPRYKSPIRESLRSRYPSSRLAILSEHFRNPKRLLEYSVLIHASELLWATCTAKLILFCFCRTHPHLRATEDSGSLHEEVAPRSGVQ